MISLKSNLFKLVFALFALTAAFSFQGCNPDDPEPPTIAFIGGTGLTTGDVTLAGGDSIFVKVTAKKGTTKKSEDLKTFKVTLRTDNSATEQAVGTPITITTPESYSSTDAIKLPIRSVASGTDEFIFTVEDKGGKTASVKIKVTIGGDQATPSITLSDADGAFVSDETVDVGTLLVFKPTFAKGSTGQNIKTWKVTASKNAGAENVIPGGENTSALNLPTVSPTIPPITATEGTWVFRFYATSTDDKSAPTKAITITVSNSTGGASHGYGATLTLGGQGNPSLGSFLSLSNGTIYKINDAKTNASMVDLAYFYTGAQEIAFGSPSDPAVKDAPPNGAFGLTGWSVYNATSFRMSNMNSTDFGNLDKNDAAGALRQAFDGGTVNSKDTRINKVQDGVAIGKVIAFKTASGKYGVFKVVAQNGTQNGDCTIDVIIQD